MTVNGKDYRVTCVSMGNPHCIVPVEDVDGLKIEEIGPFFERHPAFPARVNTEFIRVIDSKYGADACMGAWLRGDPGLRDRSMRGSGSVQPERMDRRRGDGPPAGRRSAHPLG